MYKQQRTESLILSRPGQRSGVTNGPANHGSAAGQCAPGDGTAAPFRPFSQIAIISQSGSQQQQQQALATSLHASMPRVPSASQGSNNSFTQQPHQTQHQNRSQQHNMGGVIGFTSASGLPQALVRPFSAGSRPMGHNASLTAIARPISAPAQPTQARSHSATRPIFGPLSMRPTLGIGGTGTSVIANIGCAGLSATATTATGHINMSQKSDERELYYAGFSGSQGSAGLSYNDRIPFRAGSAEGSRGAAGPSGPGVGVGGSDGGVVPNIQICRTNTAATNGLRPRSASATQRQEQHLPYSAPYEPDIEPYDKSVAPESYAAASGSQQQHGSLLPASQIEEPLLPSPLASGAGGGAGLGVAGMAQEIQMRKRQDATAIATAAPVASKVPGDLTPQQRAVHQSESFTLPARVGINHSQVFSEPHVGHMASCELPLHTQVQESGYSAAAAVPLPSIALPDTANHCVAAAAQGGYAAADSLYGGGHGLAPLSQQEPRLWSLLERRQDQTPQPQQQECLPRSEQQLQQPQCGQKHDDHQRMEQRQQQERQSKLQISNRDTSLHCHRNGQPEDHVSVVSMVTEEVQQPTPGAPAQRLPSQPQTALPRLQLQLQSQEQRFTAQTSSQEHQQQQQIRVQRLSREESQLRQDLTRGDATKELDCRIVTQIRKEDQPDQEEQCLLVQDPDQHRLQPQRRNEQKASAETAEAPFGSGPSAHEAMLGMCYPELCGTLNRIAVRTAKVEEAMLVCQQIAANMPEMLTLLHQHNAVLQGLLSAQENAAVAAATAHAAMERRFSQVLLLGEGRRRLGGGSVDATAQTSPRLTLLPSAPSPTARGVPAASGLGLTVSVAPEPRALFQALPEDGGIADDSGVAVGAGMGIGDGTVAGVGIVSVGGGGIHGGRPRRRSVGTHLQLTTTTTTVYEEEEEQQQEYDNKEEVVGDQGQKQGSEGHADRRRLDSTCRTPASKGNGPGTALRVRSVVRVQQTHTQHHCSVVEHELFPVAPEQEEYGGEALKCGDLRGPPPSSQSPLSVQQQRRGLQPIRNGDAQPAYKEGATGCREQPSSPQRQPPQGHLREGCKQAHLIWQPQQQLQTETRQRQKEQEKQQNQRPVQQKGHRAEEGRMADIVMRAVDIQTDAKKDTQGRVGVLGASSGAAGAGGRTAAKKGDVLPASLPLTELLPSAAVTVMAAQQNRCRGGAEGNRIGKPFAVAPKPLPKTAAVAEAVANAAAPMADWDEEVLPLALRREKRGCRKPEGGGTDASVSITVHGTGAAVIAKEPGAVIRRSARQRAKLGDGVHSGPLDATAIVDGITNVAADAKNLAVKSKAPTKPAQQPTQWKRKADPTEPNMLNSEHPQLLSAAEQPAKRAGCGSKKPQLNHQNTIEPQKEPQPGINLSPQSRSSGGALKKGSREGASKVFTRSGGRRREPTEGAHGNGGGDNGVVAAKIAAAAAPTNDNGMDRIHETTTGAGRSVKGKKAAKAAPALPHPKATATGPILCGGNDGNNNAVAVKKLCRRVVPATGTSVAKGAAGHSRPGTRAQNTNMASNAFAILTVVSECTDNPGSSGFGLTSQSPTPASTANATADGWNQRDVDAPGSSNGQALPKSLPGSLAGRAHGNVSGNREDDEEADEFARLVAARMLRHRQKRMKLMLASTQGAAVHS